MHPPHNTKSYFPRQVLGFTNPAILTHPLCPPPLLFQVILTPPEAQNPKSEELNVEPGLGRPLPPEVKVDGPKEELEAAVGGEAGFVQEAAKAGPEVPPAEGVPARLPAVVMETAAQVGGLAASTASSTEIAQPQKGRKPRDLELPLSPSLLGGPGPERTPGSGTGSGLQAPGPALTPSLLPTHTLVSACEEVGRVREELDCKGQCGYP